MFSTKKMAQFPIEPKPHPIPLPKSSGNDFECHLTLGYIPREESDFIRLNRLDNLYSKPPHPKQCPNYTIIFMYCVIDVLCIYCVLFPLHTNQFFPMTLSLSFHQCVCSVLVIYTKNQFL